MDFSQRGGESGNLNKVFTESALSLIISFNTVLLIAVVSEEVFIMSNNIKFSQDLLRSRSQIMTTKHF